MESGGADSWVMYGAAYDLDSHCVFALHGDFCTYSSAKTCLVQAILTHGLSAVHAVIVRLDSGLDINGCRHVVERVNGARGWWE